MRKIPEDVGLSLNDFIVLVSLDVAVNLAHESLRHIENLEDHEDYAERRANYATMLSMAQMQRRDQIRKILGDHANPEVAWETIKAEIVGSNRRSCPTCATKLGGAIGYDCSSDFRGRMKTLRFRYSDNVLEDNAWTVVDAEFSGNVVKRVSVVNQGVYQVELVGKSVWELAEMTRDDPTGRHPEQYFEVWHPGFNQYVGFQHENQLKVE